MRLVSVGDADRSIIQLSDTKSSPTVLWACFTFGMALSTIALPKNFAHRTMEC